MEELMSKGPWTTATRELRAWDRREKQRRLATRIKAKRDGYMPRSEAALALHRKAVRLAQGPGIEWVKVIVKVEKIRME